MHPVRFSAVVLAAGTSTRMGARPKLLLPLGEEPAIRRPVPSLSGADPEEPAVATACDAQAVTSALAGLDIRLQFNPRYKEGQITSVAAGVAALAARGDAVMICLGDMALLE